MVATKKRAYDNTARAAAAQHTRERIMLAAIDMFKTTHYDDMTIPRIAEAAGVSPQTVVLHFKTKEGLVEAVSRWWRPQEEELRAVPDADPLAAAQKICARYAELGEATLRVLAIEERVPGVRPILAAGRASHRNWVERTFGAKLGSGAARERRIMELVVAYDVYTWNILRRTLPPNEVIQAMAELARGVLETKGGRR